MWMVSDIRYPGIRFEFNSFIFDPKLFRIKFRFKFFIQLYRFTLDAGFIDSDEYEYDNKMNIIFEFRSNLGSYFWI